MQIKSVDPVYKTFAELMFLSKTSTARAGAPGGSSSSRLGTVR